ncbi:MAG: Wzz/FepE/Etk N-terminal domain-containing protein [Halarcobacter ebronensis]|uniref:Wzz/FepE/Etk N-terminal domain-containing protein n=1 Tax=Halarcobacter ebronensis TaxID=1462615 RepID=UPI003C70DD11
MQQNREFILEDEIDLKELFKTLWSYKKFIILFTSLITVFSIVYVMTLNPKAIYKGSLLIKIGEIKTQSSLELIDNPYNLKYLIESEYNIEKTPKKKTETGIEVSIPRSTNSLIVINAKYYSKTDIKDKIENIYNDLVKNQKEKLKMYDEFIPSKKIGNIKIEDDSINKPKKKLIVLVVFLFGFISSIILVFFLEFIKGMEKKKNFN